MQEFSPELISRYLDDDLSATERAEVEELLVSNAAARKLYQELRELGSSLRALPQQTLTMDFSDDILRRITAPNDEGARAAANANEAESKGQGLSSARTVVQAGPATGEHVAPVTASPKRWSWNSQSWPNAAAAAAVLLAAVTYMVAGPYYYGGQNTVTQLDSELAEQESAKDFDLVESAPIPSVQEDENSYAAGAKQFVIPQPNSATNESAASGDQSLAQEKATGESNTRQRDAVAGRRDNNAFRAGSPTDRFAGGGASAPQTDSKQANSKQANNAVEALADQGIEQFEGNPPNAGVADVESENRALGLFDHLSALGREPATPELLVVEVNVDEVAWDNETFRHFLEDNQIVWADSPATEFAPGDSTAAPDKGAEVLGKNGDADPPADGDQDKDVLATGEQSRKEKKEIAGAGSASADGSAADPLPRGGRQAKPRGALPERRGQLADTSDSDPNSQGPNAVTRGFVQGGLAESDAARGATPDVQLVYVEADDLQVRNVLAALQLGSASDQQNIAGLSFANATPPVKFAQEFYGLEGIRAGSTVSSVTLSDLSRLGQSIRDNYSYFTPPVGSANEPPAAEIAAATVDDTRGGDGIAAAGQDALRPRAGFGGGAGGGGLHGQSGSRNQQTAQSDQQSQSNANERGSADQAGQNDVNQSDDANQDNRAVNKVESGDGNAVAANPEPTLQPQPGQAFYRRFSVPEAKAWFGRSNQVAERLETLQRAPLEADFDAANSEAIVGRDRFSIPPELPAALAVTGEQASPPRRRVLFVLRKVVEPPLRAPDPGGE